MFPFLYLLMIIVMITDLFHKLLNMLKGETLSPNMMWKTLLDCHDKVIKFIYWSVPVVAAQSLPPPLQAEVTDAQ